MTNKPSALTIADREERPRFRSGTSSLEVLVAFTLLTSVLALTAPLVVRHGRVLTTARHYRLACEELSNQLERLSAMPEPAVRIELTRLRPSAFTAARLRGATLQGKLEPADFGQRLTLQVVWDEPERSAAPVTMAAWILPDPQQLPMQSGEEQPEKGQPDVRREGGQP